MKMHSIGFSVEDVQLYLNFDVDFLKYRDFERSCICEGSDYLIDKSDWKNQLDELEKKGYEQIDTSVVGFEKENEQYNSDWKNAVDKMRTLLDSEGFLFGWAVEYDDNLIFVTDCTKEEMLDFFEKEKLKLENESE